MLISLGRFFCIFHFKSRFPWETDSKNSFSRSSCIGSDPGLLTNPTKLKIKHEKTRFRTFLNSNVLDFPSRRRARSILTWKSDSSCQTVHIVSWKGQNYANWMFLLRTCMFLAYVFINLIMGLSLCLVVHTLTLPYTYRLIKQIHPKNKDHV